MHSLVQHFTCPRTTARSRSCPDPWSFPRLRSIDPATRVKISSILHHGVLPFFSILLCTGCWTVGMPRQQYNHIFNFNVYFQRSFWSLHAHDILADFAHFSNFCPDFAIDFDFENNETCAQNAYYPMSWLPPELVYPYPSRLGLLVPCQAGLYKL